MDKPSNLVQSLEAVINFVGGELLRRLDHNPSEKDRLAIVVALRKAAEQGAESVRRDVIAQLEQQGVQVTLAIDVDFLDAWAEQYGGDTAAPGASDARLHRPT